MGKYTISITAGHVARKHDQRTREDVERGHKAKQPYHMNCDPERTDKNVILVSCEDTREKFDAIFADAVNEYNAKQKRKDRRIGSYYDKCKADKKMGDPLEEIVFQVGDKDHHPDDAEAVAILTDAFERWQRDNPNMHVMWAVIHMDEATPHLHVCFAGTSKGRKNGLSLKAGMDAARREQGFRSTKQTPSVKTQWHSAQMDALQDVLEHHGHARVPGKGEKRRHEPVDVFKQREAVRQEKAQLEREVSQLTAQVQAAHEQIERARALADELDERERQVTKREQAVAKSRKRLANNHAAVKREHETLTREIEAAKTEREAYRAARDDLASVSIDVSARDVVDATLRAVNEACAPQRTSWGSWEKPRGVLGQLGNVWQKFVQWLHGSDGTSVYNSIVRAVERKINPVQAVSRMPSVQLADSYVNSYDREL